MTPADAIRFTIQQGRLTVHGRMGERAPMPDEVELIRDALEPLPVPWWIEAGAVVVGFAALLLLGHGMYGSGQ
jgi:hypothetical protein